ncbi:type IV pilin [Halovivax gelatinilyticus]|uniref:type IV pilin n=1 Tax=Halovivax gelatinilyticus TaxID=2961597 RepID=UPI0020CA8289|nr:type IV pilin [Halovivax gelatinilyticus]
MVSDARRTDGSSTDERGVSPAFGFALAMIVTIVLAIAVGILVSAIAADPAPDVDFEWTEGGEGADRQFHLAHGGNETVAGDTLRLELEGIGGLDANATLDDWGAVRDGSTLTVGLVENAVVEDGALNGTDEETGTDVVAFALDGRSLDDGTELVELAADEFDHVTGLRVTWRGSWSSSELASHDVDW